MKVQDTITLTYCEPFFDVAILPGNFICVFSATLTRDCRET